MSSATREPRSCKRTTALSETTTPTLLVARGMAAAARRQVPRPIETATSFAGASKYRQAEKGFGFRARSNSHLLHEGSSRNQGPPARHLFVKRFLGIRKITETEEGISEALRKSSLV